MCLHSILHAGESPTSGVAPSPVVDSLAESVVGDLDELGTLRISLDGYRGVSLRTVSSLPPALIDEDGEI